MLKLLHPFSFIKYMKFFLNTALLGGDQIGKFWICVLKLTGIWTLMGTFFGLYKDVLGNENSSSNIDITHSSFQRVEINFVSMISINLF